MSFNRFNAKTPNAKPDDGRMQGSHWISGRGDGLGPSACQLPSFSAHCPDAPEACSFLAGLFRAFEARRLELLTRRAARQLELDAGLLPDFLPSTRAVRD